ncbi:MAG: fibronectin type III-like domain-contianing protein, partial [Mycobacteriales bacterium]
PATFPADAGQLPTAGSPQQYPGVAEEEQYSEKLLVGYKWYDAHHLTPAYPFGAGLSYTTFRYGPLHVSRSTAAGTVAVATMDVTNTGRRAGIAVPQLYLGKPSTAALPQPVRQLVSYTSVPVPPGRTVRVTFPLNDRSFASWDSTRWTVVPGCYRLAAGASSRSLPSTTTVARGAGCASAALRLTTAGSFALPVPPAATTRLLAAASGSAPALVRPVAGRRLAATGLPAALPVVALVGLAVALWLRRRPVRAR